MDSRTLSVLGEWFKKFIVCAKRTVFSTPENALHLPRATASVIALGLLCLLSAPFPTAADTFKPSNVDRSFSTLEEAVAAMRAVGTQYAPLKFDRILTETDTEMVLYYTVPSVQPNPESWSDRCAVPGEYDSAQAVCTAREIYIGWAHPLTYRESPMITPPEGDGYYGYRGVCEDLIRSDKAVLGKL
jgi:hypothetical protein